MRDRLVSACGALSALALVFLPASNMAVAAAQPAQVEPTAGAWPTWLLASGSQLRPDSAPSDAANSAGVARIMGGIHLRSDLQAGYELARNVANTVWLRAMGAP